MIAKYLFECHNARREVNKEILIMSGISAEAATDVAVVTPPLMGVRVYDESGHGTLRDSRTMDDLYAEAATEVLAEAGLDCLTDEERERMVAFAQASGARALEAASRHMGLRGWLRFTYRIGEGDTIGDTAARSYTLHPMSSWRPEKSVADPTDA